MATAPNVSASAETHVADGRPRAGRVGAPAHLIGGVALNGGDRAVRADVLDNADVLVPDDQVARLRLDVRAGVRDRLARLLRPRVHVVDAAEALPVLTQRHTGLAGGPGGEIRTPRADPGPRGRLVELRDPRRVVGAGRLLLDPDFLRGEVDDRLTGARA